MNLRERLRGAVWGSLVGDALGVPVEFSDRSAREADPVREMRGYGTWNQPPGTWSDDGALLLCTLDAMASGEPLLNAASQRFVQWQREGLWTARGRVFDIGGTTAHALGRLARGVAPIAAGGTDEASNGNGSLMRILPVAFAPGKTRGEKGALAAELSRLTHAHPRSQLACAYWTVLAARLLEGATFDDALACAGRDLSQRLESHPDERSRFAPLLHPSPGNLAADPGASDGYVLHTLYAALWCHLRYQDFRDITLAAVNLGGDTDTTACVAGGLAGLRFGPAAIPDKWRSALPRQRAVDGLIDRFPLRVSV